MERRVACVAVLTAVLVAAPAAALEMAVEIVEGPAPVTGVEATSRGGFAGGSGAYLDTADGVLLATPCDEAWCLDATEPEPRLPVPAGSPEVLPDGSVASAPGDPTLAWYVLPTTRYAHAVLGDAIEAGGLAISSGTQGDDAPLVATLPEQDVFEDITPRLVDLDGDGRNEVVTLMSGASSGGSLGVWGVRDGGVALLARTPPIGRPNRWLNVAAIEDFDGDGVADVALVETPHIGGELQLWSGASLLAGAPRMIAAERGFSNHAIGSRALDLSEVVTTDGGLVLILPSADRRALRAVRYAGGRWEDVARASLPAPIATDMASVGADLALGLADGRLARVKLRP